MKLKKQNIWNEVIYMHVVIISSTFMPVTAHKDILTIPTEHYFHE